MHIPSKNEFRMRKIIEQHSTKPWRSHSNLIWESNIRNKTGMINHFGIANPTELQYTLNSSKNKSRSIITRISILPHFLTTEETQSFDFSFLRDIDFGNMILSCPLKSCLREASTFCWWVMLSGGTPSNKRPARVQITRLSSKCFIVIRNCIQMLLVQQELDRYRFRLHHHHLLENTG